MEKITQIFVIICQFMHESEIIEPLSAAVGYTAGYSEPEVYLSTATAVLYRVRKAGKYFMIKTPKDGTGQALTMLQREYELSLGITHPHIVSVFTYEPVTVVGPGIVMEYVDGRTLAQFLAENPSKAMRERVFVQLLQAVAYMHRCGVVHNDIKLDNVLVTRADNDVRLIDFGLADDDAHYLVRTPGCTPAYASPELLSRETELDARSDIYSLGVVMREIFGNTHLRLATRCMCVQREKRYANVEELLETFENCCRPTKSIIISLFVVLFLSSLLYYGWVNMVDKRQIAERDTMIERIEQDVAAMCDAAFDSLVQVPYYEFAVNDILSFYETADKYQTDNISCVVDAELNSILMAAYMKQLNASQDKLVNMAQSLPSLYKCDLTLPEIVYYDSLVSNRLPYVPYK